MTDIVVVDDASGRHALEVAARHAEAGRLVEAERICRHVLRVRPNDAGAVHLLGSLSHRSGQAKIADALFRKAIRLNSTEPAFHCSLGRALVDQGMVEEAAASFGHAIRLDPTFSEAYVQLGNIALGRRNSKEAVAFFLQAIAIVPANAKAHYKLGVAYLTEGRQDKATDCFRQALQLNPDFANAHSNLLFALHYTDTCDRPTLLNLAKDWGSTHAAPHSRSPGRYANVRDGDRRLRIGYVSADLHRHPVGYVLAAFLPYHDQTAVEVYCYSNHPSRDDVTVNLYHAAAHWRQIDGLSDDESAAIIQDDAIDVLIDLSGHTMGHRLQIFARKPAPVQATWLGYFDTTGIETMDYLIGDTYVCPETDDKYYAEKVVRLSGDYLCYSPPTSDIPVTPLPALSADYVTFCCFNNAAKITAEVVSLWSELLRVVPDSHLRLKHGAFRSQAVREHYARQFLGGGIERDRVHFSDASSYRDYLASYHEADIALDPFPYNGGATTLEALWMGVPVISLRGDRFAGRMGLTHLTAIGLGDLVADSPRDYIQKAAGLAGDRSRLATLRSGLRARLTQSPLCDGAAFASKMEQAYREMWRAWCRSSY